MKESILVQETETISIPGYDYGTSNVTHSPVSMEELHQIEQCAGWTEEDARVLRRHGDIFKDRAEEMVDSWRAVIAGQRHLAQWFVRPDGKQDDAYKSRVNKRFVQWVIDTCFRPRDQAWLDYQEEIGLRHTPAKKNQTDGGVTPPVVPLRYLIAFTAAAITSVRKFFIEAGVKDPELRRLEDAWAKALQISLALWARPYTKGGLW